MKNTIVVLFGFVSLLFMLTINAGEVTTCTGTSVTDVTNSLEKMSENTEHVVLESKNLSELSLELKKVLRHFTL